ncbi:DNA recombination protein RmuC [Herbiconiux sp. CPCC 205763]|uniref:DNA recombination protein RmuC n=1 Tax=Herbiconiux aconitum TaxID=2970913 RepID=A0ABT2GVX6_9MICO|nr:DNA recombination protein RmuC [Herbiconiux aconitum]MCS5719041.1 DNA recombination protein RmuC [Herbiconiux aconitum]
MDALLPLLIGLVLGLGLGVVGGLLVARSRRADAAGGADPTLQTTLAERTADLTSVRERVEHLLEERSGLQARLAALDATATGLRQQAEASAASHREQAALAREQAEAASLAHREQAAMAREQFEAQLAFATEQARERLAQQEAQYTAQFAAQEERLADFQRRLKAIQDAETTRAAEDSKVLVALSPVQESLREMQAKVVELETQRQQQHGELSQQLKSATESEERLRSTAETLASALRSNSTRGVWGETQLRSVVEAAGLIEHVDFDVQTSIVSDTGAGRPDMVVHLPGGKNIAVDAKVPFGAYLEASAIPSSATGSEGDRRDQLMKKHVTALKSHITALGAKGYWNGLESSPELVIAFIPSESLVSGAMEADPTIMDFAFSRKVALASPVTLWSILKSVALSWQQEVLTEDARKLFDLSKELYTRLGTTAQHIDKLGNTIERSVKDYNAFIGSLERKVYPTARKLASLNSENLFPERHAIEEAPREITGRELLAELESTLPALHDDQPRADHAQADRADSGEAIAVDPAASDASDSAASDSPVAPFSPTDKDDDDDGDAVDSADESDDERAAEVERTVAELDALGGGAALRDAAFLAGEHDRVIELEFDLDEKPSGTEGP